MTKIRSRVKPVWHETHTVDSLSGRAIIVAETPTRLQIRLKGTRQTLWLPWSIVLLKAASFMAQLNQLQKINERRRKRSVKRGITGKGR